MTGPMPPFRRPSHDDLSLGTLARRVADELALLSCLSLALQEALSHCPFATHPDAATLAGLQGIDRITQGIDDLRRLMDALPDHLPDTITVAPRTLLAPLRLRDLADRLAMAEGPRAVAPRTSSAGDVSWF